MFGDLADLWERAALDGTPVREIVGSDAAEFAESFAQAESVVTADAAEGIAALLEKREPRFTGR